MEYEIFLKMGNLESRVPERLSVILDFAKNVKNGEYFTFLDLKNYLKWLSEPSIRYSLDHLIKCGLIKKKKRKTHRFDQTILYKFNKDENL